MNLPFLNTNKDPIFSPRWSMFRSSYRIDLEDGTWTSDCARCTSDNMVGISAGGAAIPMMTAILDQDWSIFEETLYALTAFSALSFFLPKLLGTLPKGLQSTMREVFGHDGEADTTEPAKGGENTQKARSVNALGERLRNHLARRNRSETA